MCVYQWVPVASMPSTVNDLLRHEEDTFKGVL